MYFTELIFKIILFLFFAPSNESCLWHWTLIFYLNWFVSDYLLLPWFLGTDVQACRTKSFPLHSTLNCCCFRKDLSEFIIMQSIFIIPVYVNSIMFKSDTLGSVYIGLWSKYHSYIFVFQNTWFFFVFTLSSKTAVYFLHMTIYGRILLLKYLFLLHREM